jgi:TolB-like protein/class 3 adenylate cyclase
MTSERVVRRLAAILAADVVGYSRLMGRDENGTVVRLKAHRTVRFEPALVHHGGRLVKLTGDGALAEFPSAVDALGAAIEFQQAMAEANQNQPEDTTIVFRIGLHLGDLIVDGDDLYGDGVNVAARLEAEAPAGGIVISGDMYNAVIGRLKAAFDDIGSLALKNIERPIQVFRVGWNPADWQVEAVSAPQPSADALPPFLNVPLALPNKPSIAVLPFQNMSDNRDEEYFADGMVEDIITALSRFKSLFVIARNSSFSYKGKSPDIRQVGKELGVRYVLEGSVRRAGGRVRITGQLIDSETGAHLWADRFESSLEDIFELQDQVTASVVGAIAPRLDRAEMERAKRKPVENYDAYDCFLRGMANMYEQTRDSWEEALRLFCRAIELDPDFATPYGMAARCYGNRKVQNWVVDKDWEEAEIRRLALRISAIGRDDALALCWTGFSLVRVFREYDAGAALVDQALSTNPNLAVSWQVRGMISLFLGQHEVALEHLTRALRLSPLDPEAYLAETNIALAHLFQGRYEESLNWAARALGHQPNWTVAMRASAAANALTGHINEAQKIMTRMRQLDPAMSVSNLKANLSYRRAEDIGRMIDGLRLAGLPD